MENTCLPQSLTVGKMVDTVKGNASRITYTICSKKNQDLVAIRADLSPPYEVVITLEILCDHSGAITQAM